MRRVALAVGMSVFAAVLSGPHPLIGQLPEPGAAATAPNPLSDTTVKPGKVLLFDLEARFAKDVAEHGGAAFAEWFADDAVALNNGAAPLIGKVAIAKSANWSAKDYQLTWTPTDALMGPSDDMAIGVLGVNLIYAVFYQLEPKESFFENIAQDVEKRIEIDYVEVRGADFEGWDQRAILAQLVCTGLAEAVCFPCSGPPAPPIETLHKKAIVLAPGSFEHVDPTHAAIHNQLLASGIRQLHGELAEKDPAPIGFFGFSATPLSEADPPPGVSDLLERIDALHVNCGDVLLFRERELYGMTALLNRYTKEPIRFVLGLSLLVRIWEYRYNHLRGSFLEALSRLLEQNVRLYAHPMDTKDLQEAVQSISATDWQWTDTNGWVSARQLHPPPPLGHLYDYVLASNFLVPLEIPGAPKAHE